MPFFGVEVGSGQSVPVAIPKGAVLHVSNVALSPKSTGRRITLYVVLMEDGQEKEVAIATLEKDHDPNACVRVAFSSQQPFCFRAKGSKGCVHVSGYFEQNETSTDGDEEEEEEEECSPPKRRRHGR